MESGWGEEEIRENAAKPFTDRVRDPTLADAFQVCHLAGKQCFAGNGGGYERLVGFLP